MYSNDGFTKLSGYLRTDLLNKTSACSFMYGELTNAETQTKIRDALENCHIEQVEVLLYKKNSKRISILIIPEPSFLFLPPRNPHLGLHANSSDYKRT